MLLVFVLFILKKEKHYSLTHLLLLIQDKFHYFCIMLKHHTLILINNAFINKKTINREKNRTKATFLHKFKI